MHRVRNKAVDRIVARLPAVNGVRHFDHFLVCPRVVVNTVVGAARRVGAHHILVEIHDVHHVKQIRGEISRCKKELVVYGRFGDQLFGPPRSREIYRAVVKQIGAEAARRRRRHCKRVARINVKQAVTREVGAYLGDIVGTL